MADDKPTRRKAPAKVENRQYGPGDVCPETIYEDRDGGLHRGDAPAGGSRVYVQGGQPLTEEQAKRLQQ